MNGSHCLRIALAAALLAGHPLAAAADQVIFVVRHAERADGGAGAAMTTAPADPPLSAAGHERAAKLAAHLKAANIKYIFSTEFLRTRQTAAPLAQQLHLETMQSPAQDSDALIGLIKEAKTNVLVVGHSNTLPEVLRKLGVKDPIAIADTEYDNLFVVVRPETGEPTFFRLKY